MPWLTADDGLNESTKILCGLGAHDDLASSASLRCISGATLEQHHPPLATTSVCIWSSLDLEPDPMIWAIPRSCSARINPILIAACNIALTSCIDFKVLYVPGRDNQVADALSRFDVSRAISIVPTLRISAFEPPRITLGLVA